MADIIINDVADRTQISGKLEYQDTTLGLFIKHIKKGTLVEIGCGSYARVYKTEYIRCVEKSENCRFCLKISPEANEVCLKQFYMSNLYDNDDYTCEVTYQQIVYSKYPNMVVRMYDHWLHEPQHQIPELLPHILTQPPGSAIGASIYQTGFILTELMPDLDLHAYLKKISTPSITTGYTSPTQNKSYINMLGAIFILTNLVYILHCEFKIAHGDIRDRNIFLRYIGTGWKQTCTGGYLMDSTVLIDTGGWEIKLGDFGLADNINEGYGSFIIRDYEFIDNIYCLRAKWRHTCNGTDFNNIISLIKRELLEDIYERISGCRRDGQSIIDARHTFWFNKHRISPNSIFIYELPQRLMIKLLELLPRGQLPFTAV
jgi:serine/threonine protein kinase